MRRQTVEAHEGILKLLVAAGKRAEAGFALEKLVESYPGYPPAYNDLGVLYGESGEVSKALAAYEKAVSLDPENATFRKNLADHLYVAMKQPEKAVL
ncbi:MAG TPA: tetratricopeptide repeat protein, partial [Acidobacteriota bacterium]|nr:tetratricopeptide repeat protein [Acidobacteriota bacterium]